MPIFNLTAGATVDEGNNWINISWGPLSLVTPTTETNPATETPLSDYSLASGSPAINYITSGTRARPTQRRRRMTSSALSRKTNGAVDAGAVEFTGTEADLGAASWPPQDTAARKRI